MQCLCFSGLFYSAHCSADSFMLLQVARFLPFSLLNNSLFSQVGGEICILIADSQHCRTVETNTILYSNYMPIKNKKNNISHPTKDLHLSHLLTSLVRHHLTYETSHSTVLETEDVHTRMHTNTHTHELHKLPLSFSIVVTPL